MDSIVLADIVLLTHFLFVVFIVAGLLVIWVGKLMRWQWIRLFWFRILHLTSIAFVAIISVFSIPCPLTILERNLRISGGVDFYNQGFIQYWIYKVLFYHASEHTFTLIYIAFLIAVALTFFFVPIHSPFISKKDRDENCSAKNI